MHTIHVVPTLCNRGEWLNKRCTLCKEKYWLLKILLCIIAQPVVFMVKLLDMIICYGI